MDNIILLQVGIMTSWFMPFIFLSINKVLNNLGDSSPSIRMGYLTMFILVITIFCWNMATFMWMLSLEPYVDGYMSTIIIFSIFHNIFFYSITIYVFYMVHGKVPKRTLLSLRKYKYSKLSSDFDQFDTFLKIVYGLKIFSYVLVAAFALLPLAIVFEAYKETIVNIITGYVVLSVATTPIIIVLLFIIPPRKIELMQLWNERDKFDGTREELVAIHDQLFFPLIWTLNPTRDSEKAKNVIIEEIFGDDVEKVKSHFSEKSRNTGKFYTQFFIIKSKKITVNLESISDDN